MCQTVTLGRARIQIASFKNGPAAEHGTSGGLLGLGQIGNGAYDCSRMSGNQFRIKYTEFMHLRMLTRNPINIPVLENARTRSERSMRQEKN
jgi:hypothetical protein